jgi:GT2 family glycosyltransferase
MPLPDHQSMKPPVIDLSVVMVTWNTLALTTVALESLRRETKGIEYEVLVFDNGSTKDDSAHEIPRRFPWVRFQPVGSNRGFAYPNNRGIELAKGRYVLLLNNDTIQIENALGKAVAYMDAHPEVGALGIMHRNNDSARTIQPSYHRFPDPWDEILNHLKLRHTAPPPSIWDYPPAETDVDWIVGSFLLMRRECIADVGTLDERFFVYDEDIDWCRRARQKGWPVRFWPGAELIHVGNGAIGSMKDKTFMHYRSHLTYLAKHHSKLVASAFYVALSLRLTASTLWQVGRLLTGQGSIREVRARFTRQMGFLRLHSSRSGV